VMDGRVRLREGAPEEDVIIHFDGVTKAFGKDVVLQDINLAIRRGSVSVICGPSGSGKSTLLRCINGLERTQAGTITVLGRKLSERVLASSSFRSEIGMVFQRFSLYPHMTALANVMLAPRKVRRQPPDEAAQRAHEMLARVGLSDKAGAYPSQLSGGQQQRVAIARALRRANLCARSRNDPRGARRHARSRPQRSHHADRHARDGLCARGRRQHNLHGCRHDRRGGAFRQFLQLPPK